MVTVHSALVAVLLCSYFYLIDDVRDLTIGFICLIMLSSISNMVRLAGSDNFLL